MQRLLPAIALCALMHGAIAGAPQPTAAGSAAQSPILQASLVAPGTGTGTPAARRATGDTVALQAGLQDLHDGAPTKAAASHAEAGHPPTTAAMLLAALALMTGIAVRRWLSGSQ